MSLIENLDGRAADSRPVNSRVGCSATLNYMKRNNAICILALLTLWATSSDGQQEIVSPSAYQNVSAFTEIKGLPDEIEPSYFEFSASGHNYKILRNGRGKRTGGEVAARPFNLRLTKDDYLSRVIYYAEYQGDLLLTCEISDGESGAGFITRLDGRTLRMKWKRWIYGFNVGQGLIEDRYAYITAIGFLGKVDLRSGAYVWRHRNLYQVGENSDDAFNSFELPEIKGDTVLFTEAEIHYRTKVATVQVNKLNGKVIKIHR